MSEPTWTIDSIAHALPHPVTRQAFWRDVNLTPVAELQGCLDKWISFVERWQAGQPKLDAIKDYVRQNGDVPPEYRPTPEALADSEAFLDQLRADAARRQHGSSAA